MRDFKPLFKKSETGAIIEWNIRAEPFEGVGVIVTTWGQQGGATQENRETISEGKNVGKKNATTAFEQACKEAKSRWEKQQKAKKYVTNRNAALAGEKSELVEGGELPMLAFPFEKQGHKIKYPCYGNCKIDGTRCIAIVENGKATLWSRTRKPINSMPHIARALEKALPSGRHVIDGELYAAHLSDDFEQLIHLVRQNAPTEGHEVMQYWIYDTIQPNTPFSERFEWLSRNITPDGTLVLVEAPLLASEEEAMDYFASCQQQGFEGAILRNAKGLYVGKRSADLIKVKSFLDAEFEIIGIEEGRGKLAGHVGAFVCKTGKGGEFRAKLKGSLSHLAELFVNHSLWEGKKLTVRYQNLTSDGMPRFPVGIAIRDYE